jgi:hypothetical protein
LKDKIKEQETEIKRLKKENLEFEKRLKALEETIKKR